MSIQLLTNPRIQRNISRRVICLLTITYDFEIFLSLNLGGRCMDLHFFCILLFIML